MTPLFSSLIIDCDPGVDDAVALLAAFGRRDLDLAAVTVTGGNVPLEKTDRNARMLRQIAGRAEVPVHRGAGRPLTREPAGAGEFHGMEGLGDIVPFEPEMPCAAEPAAEALVRHVMDAPEHAVALAMLGPLTNLALALRHEPRLAQRLGPVAVMGGARSEGGNVTASAEFNIWADPEAAAEVLASDCDLILFGLDCTHQLRATSERIAAIEAIGTPSARTAASVMRFSQRVEREIVGWEAPPVHDLCPVAWLMRPALFTLAPCHIAVETEGPVARGHTAVEFRDGVAGRLRHRWALSGDADGVFGLLGECLS